MDDPLVSVNIITRDRAGLLPKAIDSALTQTYSPIEIVIIDNESKDNTRSVIEEYSKKNPNVKYLKTPRCFSITQSRNIALSESLGKYIAVLDDDDYWIDENKIKQQVEFLEKNSGHAIVGTRHIVVNDKDEEIIAGWKLGENELDDQKIRAKFLIKNQFIHSSVLVRKNTLEEIGGYTEDFKIWEDYATFLQIGKKNKLANLPQKMTAYKKHSTNISGSSRLKNLTVLGKIILKNRKDYPHFFKSIILVFLRAFLVLLGKK